MNPINRILENFVLTRSSVVVDELVRKCGITKTAARQRVSRGTPEMSSLKNITLPKREKIVYLRKEFGSPRYWESLISLLQESNTAYGWALGALRQRGEIALKDHFSILCGSPVRQSKHIPPETILINLEKEKLVAIIDVPVFGECVVIKKSDDAYYERLISDFKSRMFVENLVLNNVETWLKNIGFVSYSKVQARHHESESLPSVGTFHWDLTAPSYVAPLITKDQAALKPGFVVCDICLGNNISLHGAVPFIKKCETLRTLSNVGRCLQIFVADKYDKRAFSYMKGKGVLPITVKSLFGQDVAEALTYLSAALSGLAELMFNPEMFNEMFSRLSRIEGAVSNLRGAFFEFLVAEAVRSEYRCIFRSKPDTQSGVIRTLIPI